jgi:hypothetical protein
MKTLGRSRFVFEPLAFSSHSGPGVARPFRFNFSSPPSELLALHGGYHHPEQLMSIGLRRNIPREIKEKSRSDVRPGGQLARVLQVATGHLATSAAPGATRTGLPGRCQFGAEWT